MLSTRTASPRVALPINQILGIALRNRPVMDPLPGAKDGDRLGVGVPSPVRGRGRTGRIRGW